MTSRTIVPSNLCLLVRAVDWGGIGLDVISGCVAKMHREAFKGRTHMPMLK